MMVASKVERIANLPLHVLDPLPHHYLTSALLNEVRFALDYRPVQLLLALQVVSLQGRLVLLHQTHVHLGRVPLVHPVVKLPTSFRPLRTHHFLPLEDELIIAFW